MKCLLIDDKNFTKTIEIKNFTPSIEIAVRAPYYSESKSGWWYKLEFKHTGEKTQEGVLIYKQTYCSLFLPKAEQVKENEVRQVDI